MFETNDSRRNEKLLLKINIVSLINAANDAFFNCLAFLLMGFWGQRHFFVCWFPQYCHPTDNHLELSKSSIDE